MNTSILPSSPILSLPYLILSISIFHLSAAQIHTHRHTGQHNHIFQQINPIHRTDKQTNRTTHTVSQLNSQTVRQPYTLKINLQPSVQAYILKLNNSIQIKLKCTPRMSFNSSTPLSFSPLSLSITTTEMPPHTQPHPHTSTFPPHTPPHTQPTHTHNPTHTLPSQQTDTFITPPTYTHIHSHNFSHNSS